MRRGEVLELVDEHQPARPLRRRSGVGLAEQDLDRPVDLVVEVDGALAFELGAVLRPHLGETVDVAVVPPFDVERVDAARAGSRSAPRSTVPPGRCCGASGTPISFDEDAADVGLVDRAPRPRLGEERWDAVDDGERDRVERADLQAGEVGRAFAHLLLGPLVEGDEADGARRQPPADEQVAGPLGEHPGLARIRRGR